MVKHTQTIRRISKMNTFEKIPSCFLDIKYFAWKSEIYVKNTFGELIRISK